MDQPSIDQTEKKKNELVNKSGRMAILEEGQSEERPAGGSAKGRLSNGSLGRNEIQAALVLTIVHRVIRFRLSQSSLSIVIRSASI